ncbi:hypothetical protein B0O99DRAFT_600445 [Bisporella sp. PMI_857]|nr:hypothetical protein B0O99DRAFT_600445 [Bisporella sp. PMI_857]
MSPPGLWEICQSIVWAFVTILLALGMFFAYVGLFSPFFYVTSWSVHQGLNTNISFCMISLINAANLFGCIIPGILADRYGSYNMMTAAAFTSGIICCCWVKATSLAGVAMLSLAYGFCSGGVTSPQVACATVIKKPQDCGVVVGCLMTFISHRVRSLPQPFHVSQIINTNTEDL